jgi:hypothetical protein
MVLDVWTSLAVSRENDDQEYSGWGSGSFANGRKEHDDPWDDCEADTDARGTESIDLIEISEKTEKFQADFRHLMHKHFEAEENAGAGRDSLDPLIEMTEEALIRSAEVQEETDLTETFGSGMEDIPDPNQRFSKEKAGPTDNIFKTLRSGTSLEVSPLMQQHQPEKHVELTQTLESLLFKPERPSASPITSLTPAQLGVLSVPSLPRQSVAVEESVYQPLGSTLENTTLHSLFALPPAAVPVTQRPREAEKEPQPYMHDVSPLMQGLPSPVVGAGPALILSHSRMPLRPELPKMQDKPSFVDSPHVNSLPQTVAPQQAEFSPTAHFFGGLPYNQLSSTNYQPRMTNSDPYVESSATVPAYDITPKPQLVLNWLYRFAILIVLLLVR